jgi:thiol:disulfide interchange protein
VQELNVKADLKFDQSSIPNTGLDSYYTGNNFQENDFYNQQPDVLKDTTVKTIQVETKNNQPPTTIKQQDNIPAQTQVYTQDNIPAQTQVYTQDNIPFKIPGELYDIPEGSFQMPDSSFQIPYANDIFTYPPDKIPEVIPEQVKNQTQTVAQAPPAQVKNQTQTVAQATPAQEQEQLTQEGKNNMIYFMIMIICIVLVSILLKKYINKGKIPPYKQGRDLPDRTNTTNWEIIRL